MERSNIALIAVASLVLASGAIAQQPAPRAAPPAGQAQEVQLSDADLEKFADIYVDLANTDAKFEDDLAGAQTEDEAREVQARMEEENVAKLVRHGWTPERYVSVVKAINSNPQLAEKTLAIIERRN
jgi:hypothetical protein